ncbi:myosin-VIIa-like isoform X2 [Physella acuta]|nr:myosin-VIIa-like isoform X2 [Physella acuta]
MFAQTKFSLKAPHGFSCSLLPQPLLPTSDKAQYLAALASWVTILRIMGDLPDVDTGNRLIVAGAKTPLTTKLKICFKVKYTKKDIDDAHRKYSDLFKDPAGSDSTNIPFLSATADTMLEKIQLVCAIGIYKPALRDELYCQLCKQLTNNPSRNSVVRGWVLMSLFAGSFIPSEKFAPCLSNFLAEGPVEFAEKVDWLLRRTCTVGTRGYPPSWLEFQAAKNGKPLLVPVSFMSGHRILCEVDAAMTVAEVIRHISERLGLQELTGYSLYISLHTKISCLGNGQHRIMDAISESEQFTKQMGVRESNAIWRLFFRLEYFSSWFSPEEDLVSTELVYQQVKRGITMSEYRLDTEEMILSVAAKIFYIENPEDVNFTNLETFISTFIPETILERRPKDYYPDKVKAMFYELKLDKEKPTENSLKSELVKLAMENFFILFSRYYDVTKVVGTNIQLNEVVVGVNNKGIYVVDDVDKLRLHIEFCEIVDVIKSKHHLTIAIANQDNYMFSTHHSDDFYNLVTKFIEELTKRSTIAIAKEDITPLDGPADSNIIKGDVLELSQNLVDLGDAENLTVLCTRTKKPNDVPVRLCYILATVVKPSDDLLSRLKAHVNKQSGTLLNQELKQCSSLQQYAKVFFRPSNDNAVTKFLSKASIKKKDNDALWSYSKDGLKKPLLKRTCNREDVRKVATHCFASLQTYMSNPVFNDEIASFNLCTEWILNPARRNKYLREEIYCQIIKQLTNNPDKSQSDRGWVVLTLLTSMIPPSYELFEHCLAFLKGSSHPLAKMAENNLKLKKQHCGNRLYSSHFLEHEMVIKQQPNVRIQLFLPNHSTQTLEIASHTRIYEIKKDVVARLHLKSFQEYSLFFSSSDKVHCLPDRAFYFDCLSHAEIFWYKQSRKSQSGTKQSHPMLVMLKKIWVNGQPGIDQVADQIFHYGQEMPNYLRGYHQMPDSTVIKLAALCYRSQFGDDASHFTKFGTVATQIFPKNFLTSKAGSDIQKDVVKQYQNHPKMSLQEAKSAFLQELSQLSTYGSVFFEVKQRHAQTLPKHCLIAINYSGVHIIDANTRSLHKTYNFDIIPNWAYDENSFTLIVGEGNSTIKLFMETKVGHNMDDLLMSYIGWIMNYQMRKKYGSLGETSGESIC